MADEKKKQTQTQMKTEMERDDDEIGEEQLQEEQRQLARFHEEYEDTELYAPYTRNGKVIDNRVFPWDSDNERNLKQHVLDKKRREKKQKRRAKANKNKKAKVREEDDEDDEDEAERAEIERRLKGCGKPMGPGSRKPGGGGGGGGDGGARKGGGDPIKA
jgi:hypothetical protein